MSSVEIKTHLNSCRCLKKQIPNSCTNACVCPVPQALTHRLPAEHCSASENQYCRRTIFLLLASYQNQTFISASFPWMTTPLSHCHPVCFLIYSLPATMLKHQTIKHQSSDLGELFELSCQEQSKLRTRLLQGIGFFSNIHIYFFTYSGSLHCAALYAASVELPSHKFCLTSLFSGEFSPAR